MEPSSKTFIVDHKITDGKNTIVTRYSDQKLAKEGARNNFPFLHQNQIYFCNESAIL